jgi:hypothetical protein
VFENRVLRRIFGPKRDEIIGGWRKLHNEELHNLYSSPNIIIMIKSSRIRWVRLVTCVVEKLKTYRAFVGKLKGNRRLGGPRYKGKDNVKMDREIGWSGMN